MTSITKEMLPQTIVTIRLYLSNIAYIEGTITKVSGVEKNSPPITVMARGFQRFDPSLLSKAIGKSPKIVVAVVIITGRSLSLAA